TLVLDLVYADGMIVELLQKYNPAYTFAGIDFSQKMVEICSQKAIYSKIIHADLSEGLPREICSQRYDLILATGCLEFIQNHENLFSQIQKVLKPNGQFWLTLQARTDKNSK